MKKYFFIWFITGFLSEIMIYCSHRVNSMPYRDLCADLAFFFNPYSLVYLGAGNSFDGCVIAFLYMHFLRFIWLFLAAILEHISWKYRYAKYVARTMLAIYLLPSLFI